jgi:multidrug resistance efflux pump
MKEILLPYALLCWVLFRFGILKKTALNYFITVFIGIILAMALFFGHRLWSPADLTQSTQIRAPHTVLSPAIGQQIDKIYVTHNQHIKKGEILYSLTSDSQQAKWEEASVLHEQAERNLKRVTSLGEFGSKIDVQDAQDELELTLVRLDTATYNLSRQKIVAPHDGMVTHVYFGEGSRIGALHLWDTSKKFVEMRIPDQAYANVKIGQFAEFYVDAYPGEIFRAKVHSKVDATGESQGGLFPTEQNVRAHIGLGALPVGRTVILEFTAPEGYAMPIGATGSAWISAQKPHSALGFIDIIGGATIRLYAIESFIKAL